MLRIPLSSLASAALLALALDPAVAQVPINPIRLKIVLRPDPQCNRQRYAFCHRLPEGNQTCSSRSHGSANATTLSPRPKRSPSPPAAITTY